MFPPYLARPLFIALLLHSCLAGADDFVDYDPLEAAIKSISQTQNLEATVPAMCYTKTDGIANPCWTCHTLPQSPNFKLDADLQEEYSFSEFALANRWKHLFEDRRDRTASIPDDEALQWVRTDNYRALRGALSLRKDYPGYVPDLDFTAGFDAEGFARDGSAWRAVRYKPFLGTFWPTNGNTDDVFIRLPQKFREPSREAYIANLAIVEKALCSNPRLTDQEIYLPIHYVGAASRVPVRRRLYPEGTEFLHTVRYLDPDRPSMISARMKEVRYARKTEDNTVRAMRGFYQVQVAEKADGDLPEFGGSPTTGYRNDFGWRFQGFIEDGQGRLRLQTEEEHLFCMGCHNGIGVTVDSTFSFPRKVPGAEGWRYQNLEGLKDHPQTGHGEPETLRYFKRVHGGDEFRANTEILTRFFEKGDPKEKEVRRASKEGDKDLAWLLLPSRERALALDKAYMALVHEQRFDKGRDTLLAPPENVHAQIENGSTDLQASGQVYVDGSLWLDWER